MKAFSLIKRDLSTSPPYLPNGCFCIIRFGEPSSPRFFGELCPASVEGVVFVLGGV